MLNDFNISSWNSSVSYFIPNFNTAEHWRILKNLQIFGFFAVSSNICFKILKSRWKYFRRNSYRCKILNFEFLFWTKHDYVQIFKKYIRRNRLHWNFRKYVGRNSISSKYWKKYNNCSFKGSNFEQYTVSNFHNISLTATWETKYQFCRNQIWIALSMPPYAWCCELVQANSCNFVFYSPLNFY